ncbi:hypothetical protein DXG01_006443 [Tephrocybe rancida]|nr:hypothetical protein DXG01_006443 [Tephrocybe rancida]
MPSTQQWLTFTKWGEKYGKIASITVLGQPIIILNSVKIANDMLDKKSHIYSDRPILQMGGNLVGWKNSLILLPYGDRFRRCRRMFRAIIGSRTTVNQFSHIEELETHRFLRRVLTEPKELATHIRRIAGSIILRISHGYEVEANNDPFVELADKAMEEFSLSTAPGAFLVDVLPLLRYVPAWLPGTGFLKKAKEWSAITNEMVDQPHTFVKRGMSAGTAPISFTSSFLERKTVNPEEEFDIKWCAASLYAGGADTTVSANYSFFLAMALHPEVAKKAQAEIDSIIGNDRLPTFNDRPHLPYVDALSKEVFRWNAVVSTSFPHRSITDNLHDGYFIPEGSLILANIWGLLHDPEVYANPNIFNPDRFVATDGKSAELDPRNICFGFGRRCSLILCFVEDDFLLTFPAAGKHLADASVFILCAMSLAVFDISKVVENGIVVEPVLENTDGTVSHPKPYKCSIKPRSQKAVALVLEAEEH